MHGFKKHFVDNINVSDFLAEMFSYLSSVIACCGPDCQWKIHHVFTHKNTQNTNFQVESKAKVKHFQSRSGGALACNRQFRFIYHLFECRTDLLNPLRILSSLPDGDEPSLIINQLKCYKGPNSLRCSRKSFKFIAV